MRIQRVSLGRNAKVGSLYDARTDKFIDGLSIFDQRILNSLIRYIPCPQVRCDIKYSDSRSDRCKNLELGRDEEIAVLGLDASFFGSAEYLGAEQADQGYTTVSLIHRNRLFVQTVNIFDAELVRRISMKDTQDSLATHVLIEIELGVTSVISLSFDPDNEQEKQATSKELALLILTAVSESIHGTSGAMQSHSHSRRLRNLKLEFYTDVDLVHQKPEDLKNCAMVIKEIAFSLGENAINLRPVIYTLVPLYVLKLLTNRTVQVHRTWTAGSEIDRMTAMKTLTFIRIFESSRISLQKLYRRFLEKTNFFNDSVIRRVAARKHNLDEKIETLKSALAGCIEASWISDTDAVDIRQTFQLGVSIVEDIRQFLADFSFVNRKLVYLRKCETFDALALSDSELLEKILSKGEYFVFFTKLSKTGRIFQQNWTTFQKLCYTDPQKCILFDTDTCYSKKLRKHFIAHYLAGCSLEDDVCKLELLLEKYNVIKLENATEGSLKPSIQHCHLEIVCPGGLLRGRCDQEKRIWICYHCNEVISYATDGCLHCKCGKSDPFAAKWLCKNPNHGSRWSKFEETSSVNELGEAKRREEFSVLLKELSNDLEMLRQRELLRNCNIIRFKDKPKQCDCKPIRCVQLQVPCPKSLIASGCSAQKRDWLCYECQKSVEYGFSKRLYCECGESETTSALYCCQDCGHGAYYLEYKSNDLEKQLNEITIWKEFNVLLIGETGVGKSTWINSIANYVLHGSLDAALEAPLTCLIPCSFSLQEQASAVRDIRVGKTENEIFETGNSATQKPKAYAFKYKNVVIRLIDVPGVCDTRGTDQDKINFDHILQELRTIYELHAICIFLVPNAPKLTLVFEYCVNELFTHLCKSAARNIVFCFTKTRQTFYKAGQTLPILKQYLDNFENSRKVRIPLEENTMYYFDNEGFRLLCAIKDGVEFMEKEQEAYRESWNISTSETIRFLDYVIQLEPQRTRETLSLNETKRIIINLTVPLAQISENINTNLRLLEREKEQVERLEAENDKAKKDEVLKNYNEKMSVLTARHGRITEICASFGAFLDRNSILPHNDIMMEYLRLAIKMVEQEAAELKNTDRLDYLENYRKQYEEELNILKSRIKKEGQEITIDDVLSMKEELFSMNSEECNVAAYLKAAEEAEDMHFQHEDHFFEVGHQAPAPCVPERCVTTPHSGMSKKVEAAVAAVLAQREAAKKKASQDSSSGTGVPPNDEEEMSQLIAAALRNLEVKDDQNGSPHEAGISLARDSASVEHSPNSQVLPYARLDAAHREHVHGVHLRSSQTWDRSREGRSNKENHPSYFTSNTLAQQQMNRPSAFRPISPEYGSRGHDAVHTSRQPEWNAPAQETLSSNMRTGSGGGYNASAHILGQHEMDRTGDARNRPAGYEYGSQGFRDGAVNPFLYQSGGQHSASGTNRSVPGAIYAPQQPHEVVPGLPPYQNVEMQPAQGTNRYPPGQQVFEQYTEYPPEAYRHVHPENWSLTSGLTQPEYGNFSTGSASRDEVPTNRRKQHSRSGETEEGKDKKSGGWFPFSWRR